MESLLRAMREDPSAGVLDGIRPEPTLDEARVELAREVSRIANALLKDKYGPLVGIVTLVIEELVDRLLPGSRMQNKEWK
jgi:hypothetical protein